MVCDQLKVPGLRSTYRMPSTLLAENCVPGGCTIFWLTTVDVDTFPAPLHTPAVPLYDCTSPVPHIWLPRVDPVRTSPPPVVGPVIVPVPHVWYVGATPVPLDTMQVPLDPGCNTVAELAPLPTNNDPVPQPTGRPHVRMPAPETGEPETWNPPGTPRPTEVTEPVPGSGG